MSGDLKFRHSFSCIVSGPSGSGKSSLCIRFLQNLDYLITEETFAGGIVWCYGEESAVPSRHHLPAKFRFNEGFPEDFGSANGEPCLASLHDWLMTFIQSKCVNCLRGVAIIGI